MSLTRRSFPPAAAADVATHRLLELSVVFVMRIGIDVHGLWMVR
jgi:hypothetical protein